MVDRPLLKPEEVEMPVSDWELDNALKYVRENCKRENDEPMELDKDFLRVLFDTSRETRRPGVILPLHVARTVSSVIRLRRKEELPRYEGYKRGVMKIFADRYANSPAAKERQRASAAETRRTGKKRLKTYPLDTQKKYKDQFKLL